MVTPNMMPRKAEVRPNPEYAGECCDRDCCPVYYVPRIVGGKHRPVRRDPVPIRNTALAEQLRSFKN